MPCSCLNIHMTAPHTDDIIQALVQYIDIYTVFPGNPLGLYTAGDNKDDPAYGSSWFTDSFNNFLYKLELTEIIC